MKIKFTEKDFLDCFSFSLKYHLSEFKSNYNRTTGQYRGLGSIINDFFFGKLIEVGVAKAIQSYNPEIDLPIDFKIYPLEAQNRNDPDINIVNENSIQRKPKLFLEIKSISQTDRYLGLTKEQFTTIKTSKLIAGNSEKLFLIYAYFNNENDKLNSDLFGVFLKSQIKNDLLNDLLNEFCNINDIYLSVSCIIRGDELENRGIEFEKGSNFYETEIISYPLKSSSIKTIKRAFLPNVIIENQQLNDLPFKIPDEFGEFILKGKIKLYTKTNKVSKTVYIEALANSFLINEVIGNFELKKNEMYQLKFNTMGRDPVLKRNNLWLAKRNVTNIVNESVESRLKFISENI